MTERQDPPPLDAVVAALEGRGGDPKSEEDPQLRAVLEGIAGLRSELATAKARASEADFLDKVIDDLPSMLFVKEAKNLTFVRVNRAFEGLMGHGREELLGRNDSDFFPPDQADFFTTSDRNVLKSGRLLVVEEPITTRSDERRLKTRKIPMRGPDGEPAYLLGISEDITDRQLARERFERANLERMRAKEELSVLLHHFPGAVWTTDFELRVVSAVGACSKQLGLGPDAIGESLAERIPAAALAIGALHAVADLGRGNYEFQDGGRTFQVAVSTLRTWERANLIWVATDVTEHRKIDAEMLRARLERGQKLEQIGLLAGGVALDFNNLLTAVLGNASLARQSLDRGSKAVQYIERIEESADVAADLSRQLLAYSGQGRLLLEPLLLSEVVERMATLLASSVAKGATFEFDFEEDAPHVRGDSAQLRQLIMNLIINASDALGGSDGRITLRTRTLDVVSGELDALLGADKFGPGKYVVLEVADTGYGMDEDTIERIFDPFFSTKPRGHGLGLAATLGIVRGHGGKIRVRSEPRKGSSFELYLPASPDVSTSSTHLTRIYPPPHKGTVVLVVDDEESVRRLATAALTEAGCDVVTAQNGVEALKRIGERNDVAVVLLDVMMPQMDGAQTLRLLRDRVPKVRIILTSGYGEEGVRQRLRTTDVAFIKKPYRAEDLVAKVAQILDQDPAP